MLFTFLLNLYNLELRLAFQHLKRTNIQKESHLFSHNNLCSIEKVCPLVADVLQHLTSEYNVDK